MGSRAGFYPLDDPPPNMRKSSLDCSSEEDRRNMAFAAQCPYHPSVETRGGSLSLTISQAFARSTNALNTRDEIFR